MAIVDNDLVTTEAGLDLPDSGERQEYYEYAITAALEAMTAARGEVCPWPGNVATPEYLREAGLGAFVELGELINCLPWKPWRQYPEVMSREDRADALREWADVEVFLTLIRRHLAVAHGFEARDFARAYLSKLLEVGARARGEVPGREPPIGSCSGPYPGAACSIHGRVH